MTAIKQDAALNERVVAESDRLNQQPADARPRKNRLGDHRAGQHGAKLQTDHRDDGNQAVAKRVTKHAARPRHASRARGQHVELAQFLDDAGTGHPRQNRGERRRQA